MFFGPGSCGVFYCGRQNLIPWPSTTSNHFIISSITLEPNNHVYVTMLYEDAFQIQNKGDLKLHYHRNLFTKIFILYDHPMNSQTIKQPMKIWRTYHGSPTRPNGKALHSCVALSSGTVYDSWNHTTYYHHNHRDHHSLPCTYYFIWTIGWIWICIVLINIQSVSIQGLCLVKTVRVLNIFIS
jgi:hypothetical protein